MLHNAITHKAKADVKEWINMIFYTKPGFTLSTLDVSDITGCSLRFMISCHLRALYASDRRFVYSEGCVLASADD